MQFPNQNEVKNSEAKTRILRGDKIFTIRETFFKDSIPL